MPPDGRGGWSQRGRREGRPSGEEILPSAQARERRRVPSEARSQEVQG